jgi:hypothetical protein
MEYINTLSKFGTKVDGYNQRVKFPKLKTRYRVLFEGIAPGVVGGGDIITMDMKNCNTPKGAFQSQSIEAVNGTIYYPGKWEWQTISFSVYDSYDNANYWALFNQLQQQRDLAEQVTGTVAENYKFITKFEETDGHQNAISTWVMEGCFLLSAKPSDSENGNHEAKTIDCELRYDNAMLYDYDGTAITDNGAKSTFMNRILAAN